MLRLTLRELVWQSEAIVAVRPAGGTDEGLRRRFEVLEVLKIGGPPLKPGSEIAILKSDYDSVMGVHEPPVPGMHTSPAYRVYATATKPEEMAAEHIAFLRRCRYEGGKEFVYTVAGARETLAKRLDVLEAARTGGPRPAT